MRRDYPIRCVETKQCVVITYVHGDGTKENICREVTEVYDTDNNFIARWDEYRGKEEE